MTHAFNYQFGLTVSSELSAVHNDDTDDYPSHYNLDQGLMNYDSNPNESIAEFFIDFIYLIRDQLDGIKT